LKKIAVAMAFACASVPALADWVPSLLSTTFTGTVAYNGKSVSINEPNGGKMSSLASKVYGLPGRLKTPIDDALKASLPSGSTFTMSSIGGPINASLAGMTGQYAGYNRISFSGLTYTASVQSRGSKYGISFTCYTTLKASNVSVSVAYQPYTGVINPDPQVTNLQLNPSSSVTCESSLDWLPIIGDLIDDWVAGKISRAVVGQVNDFASSAINAILPYGPSYLGIYDVIPVGAYMVNGVDVGLYLKNNFSSLFTGKTLSMSLGPYNPAPVVYGTGEPWNTTFTSNVVTIDFSDQNTQLTFSVKDTRDYLYRWKCSVRDPSKVCQIP
jgi:hypothetical protein